MFISSQPLQTAKAHIQSKRQYTHDTGIDQIQIHAIMNTGANVCITNSGNKYRDKYIT